MSYDYTAQVTEAGINMDTLEREMGLVKYGMAEVKRDAQGNAVAVVARNRRGCDHLDTYIANKIAQAERRSLRSTANPLVDGVPMISNAQRMQLGNLRIRHAEVPYNLDTLTADQAAELIDRLTA